MLKLSGQAGEGRLVVLLVELQVYSVPGQLYHTGLLYGVQGGMQRDILVQLPYSFCCALYFSFSKIT